ncbi:hypothetical protein YPPY48_2379, partial [Yersinia pestis PY-48]
MNPWEYE